ncbi:MAG: hypothetical protein KDA61_04820, partial [Planctomycetales bacterium]|nr:hypothetical protein [Planctomycetales bacterium]
MSSPTARGGRRRRVLNEEFLSASSIMIANHLDADESPVQIPRYGEQANIENHPQITDFVPRRRRALLLCGALGLGTAVGGQLVVHESTSLAAHLPGVSSESLASAFGAGPVTWVSAVYLLLAAGAARLLYTLRRHRVDDYRGRYRVWRWASYAALFASVDAVCGFHGVLGQILATTTGVRMTSIGAEWWLLPAL